MKLKELEKCVRSNFVFDKSNEHKEMLSLPSHWRVVEKQYCNNDMVALIVFCGVAWMLGFRDEDVFYHVDIKRAKHTGLLSRYKQALQHHQAGQSHELFADAISDVNKLIMDKAQLILNAVNVGKPSYISLADFDF